MLTSSARSVAPAEIGRAAHAARAGRQLTRTLAAAGSVRRKGGELRLHVRFSARWARDRRRRAIAAHQLLERGPAIFAAIFENRHRISPDFIIRPDLLRAAFPAGSAASEGTPSASRAGARPSRRESPTPAPSVRWSTAPAGLP